MTIYYTLLFGVGLLFGSFSSVLIHRWHKGEDGMWLGRSKCPSCKHILGPLELIPLISYMSQNGKCRSCRTPIPIRYPIFEIFFGFLFIGAGYCIVNLLFGIGLISEYTDIEGIFLGIILIILFFITGLYILYDILYTEIPDRALVPGIYLYLTLLIFGALGYGEFLLFDRWSYTSTGDLVWDHILAALILYSFFYLQILIPGVIYALKKQKYSLAGEIASLYFLFPFLLIIDHFRGHAEKEGEEEVPTWIGGGDLRLALFIGLTLGLLHGVIAVVVAYCMGSLFALLLLFSGKSIRKRKIPFGPFLGAGWIFSMLMYTQILDFLSI